MLFLCSPHEYSNLHVYPACVAVLGAKMNRKDVLLEGRVTSGRGIFNECGNERKDMSWIEPHPVKEEWQRSEERDERQRKQKKQTK